MKILALEFSSSQRSVAVVQSGGGPCQPSNLAEVIEAGERSTPALRMIEQALRQAAIERERVELLAVGLGPGSYTGIRAAIALAQGWQLGSPPGQLKLLGLSSAACLAAQAQAQGLFGRVAVVIDAQRHDLYLAEYEIAASGWQETSPLRLAALAEALRRQDAGVQLVGPEATKWSPSGRVLFPRAGTLARLALHRTDFVTGEKLEPIYLREPAFVKAPPSRTTT